MHTMITVAYGGHHLFLVTTSPQLKLCCRRRPKFWFTAIELKKIYGRTKIFISSHLLSLLPFSLNPKANPPIQL